MKTIKIILVILSGIFFSACHEELGYDDIPVPSSGEKSVEVTVRLNTPSGFPSRARALTGMQENEIHDAYVFGFKTGVLSYVKVIEEIADTDNGKSFKVTLSASKDASDTYKLMILANAGDRILSLAGNDLKGLNGKTYNEVQQVLMETGISEAMFTSGGSIVMWGELPYEEIKNTNKTFSVSLVRSIARIDVGVGATGFDAGSKLATWGGLPDFVLEGVYLYKPNNAYYFVPRAGHFDETDKITVLPSPAGSQLASPLIYAVSDGKSLVRNIYTVESDIRIESNAASGDKNHTNRAAIVVKGSYKGNPSSYYRLDFINSTRELINILRNHLYQFNIKSVSGNGFGSPDEAYESLSVNMDVEVIDWNDGDIGDITFDGQYMLGVSKGQFILSKEERTAADTDNRMSVITDVPGGWTVENITDAQGGTETVSWLTVSRNSGPANSKLIVSILTEENNLPGSRTGYIHIKAGRLSYKVEVIQTSQSKIDLRIKDESGTDISELFFNSHVGGTVPEQLFQVSWLPEKASLYVSVLPVEGADAFQFGTGDVIISGPVIGAGGHKSYTIQPPAITSDELAGNPLLKKALKVDFTVMDETSYITKSIILVQKAQSIFDLDAIDWDKSRVWNVYKGTTIVAQVCREYLQGSSGPDVQAVVIYPVQGKTIDFSAGYAARIYLRNKNGTGEYDINPAYVHGGNVNFTSTTLYTPGVLPSVRKVVIDPSTGVTAAYDSAIPNLTAKPVTVTDYDNNVYPIVKINQWYWTATNLRTTHFMNGNVFTASPYGDNASNTATYGLLYSGYTAVEPQPLLPGPWHMPSITEYDQLFSYLAPEGGSKIKANHLWQPLDKSDNISGFSLLPGGTKTGGTYSAIGTAGYLWADTNNGFEGTFYSISSEAKDMTRGQISYNNAFSLRLILTDASALLNN